MIRLWTGDSLELLPMLDDNSVDSVVTDPPYHLTSMVKRLSKTGVDDIESNFTKTIPGQGANPFATMDRGFMGQKWDGGDVAFRPELWREVLRVLKPGAYLLAFGGTRTYHRMAVAIEDAGFEIRDQLGWLYGQGFPKSLDVSKAFDRAAGAEREVIGPSKWAANAGADGGNEVFGAQTHIMHDTRPTTDLAKQWDGWGTALKPAWEPIVMARKPLEGTVAANLAKWGTGAINIKECRIEVNMRDVDRRDNASIDRSANTSTFNLKKSQINPTLQSGRWPANILHDGSDEVMAAFPMAAGQLAASRADGAPKNNHVFGAMNHATETMEPRADATKSASRFFYCAKTTGKDRDEGCDHLPVTSAADMVQREEGSDGMNSPRAGAGRTSGRRNHHPTIKPTALMRYLCRLITPPGGTVLDPFMGSGSTGKAAVLEGFSFTGIELSPEYTAIARARIAVVEGVI